MAGNLKEKSRNYIEHVVMMQWLQKAADDGGIDILLTKNGARFGVQCKNWHKPVAQSIVRELAGAILHANLDGGIVIASSGYTKRAKEFVESEAINIKLLDMNDVLRMHGASFTK